MSAFAVNPANSYMRPNEKYFMVFPLPLYISESAYWSTNVFSQNSADYRGKNRNSATINHVRLPVHPMLTVAFSVRA